MSIQSLLSWQVGTTQRQGPIARHHCRALRDRLNVATEFSSAVNLPRAGVCIALRSALRLVPVVRAGPSEPVERASC
jgi:hypothetical protein